jgi:hypothetical protein
VKDALDRDQKVHQGIGRQLFSRHDVHVLMVTYRRSQLGVEVLNEHPSSFLVSLWLQEWQLVQAFQVLLRVRRSVRDYFA